MEAAPACGGGAGVDGVWRPSRPGLLALFKCLTARMCGFHKNKR